MKLAKQFNIIGSSDFLFISQNSRLTVEKPIFNVEKKPEKKPVEPGWGGNKIGGEEKNWGGKKKDMVEK